MFTVSKRLVFISTSKAGKYSSHVLRYKNMHNVIVDTGKNLGYLGPKVYITHEHSDHCRQLKNYLHLNPQVIFPYTENNKYINEVPYKKRLPLHPGDVLKTTFYTMKTFECDHTVPSLGYCFDFGKDQFAICGDTTERVFIKNKWLPLISNIYIECTFFRDNQTHLAKSGKHMHWEQLKPVIKDFPDTRFYIGHFSNSLYHDEVEMYTQEFENIRTICK